MTAKRQKSDVDQLISNARSGGQPVAQGRFRLDWRRALEKIKRYKLAEPYHYVLELVRAGVAGGASQIQIDMDADDMHMRFDGKPYTLDELSSLFDHLFSQDPEHRRLQALALGINTALGMNPKFITVTSGNARLRIRALSDMQPEELTKKQAPGGTHIHLRERKSWKVIAEALHIRENPEEALLRKHCRFAPIPVTLQGDDLRLYLEPDDYLSRSFTSGHVRGEFVLPSKPLAQSEVTFCLNGIQVVHTSENLDYLSHVGLLAWVDNPRLVRNASHSGVVLDAEYWHTMNVLRQALKDMLRTWLRIELLEYQGESDLTWRAPPEANQDFQKTRKHYLQVAAGALLKTGKPLTPELEALLDQPGLVSLPLPDPAESSLRPFWNAFQKEGICRRAWNRYDLTVEDLPDKQPVALGPDSMLNAIFGNRKKSMDATLEVLEERHKVRQANRKERESRRQAVEFPEMRALEQVEVKSTNPPLYGKVCLATGKWSEPELEVTFLKAGVPLEVTHVQNPRFHGLAVLDSEQFRPTDLWDGVVKDRVYKKALSMVNAVALDLLKELRNRDPQPGPAAELLEQKFWTPEKLVSAGSDVFPWPRHEIARQARQHIDWLLENAYDPDEGKPDWLWNWPLFWSLAGDRALSLSELAAMSKFWYVVEKPWGEGTDDKLVLNLTQRQLKICQRLLSMSVRVTTYASALTGRRKRLSREVRKKFQRQKREAKNREIYEKNQIRARVRHQRPRLSGDYLAIVDLPASLGPGQAGIPRRQNEPSWIRFLCKGAPICDTPAPPKYFPFPVQAVIEAADAEPNETFDAVRPKSLVKRVFKMVLEQIGPLVEKMVQKQPASSEQMLQTVWAYLRHLNNKHRAKFEDLPEPVTRLPLVDTLSHDRRSLDQLNEQAKGFVLQRIDPDARLGNSQDPLLVCGAGRGRLIGNLLGTSIANHTEEHRRLQEIRMRKSAPRQLVVLSEKCITKTPIQHAKFRGEVGIGKETGAYIQILKDGRPLEKIMRTIHDLPLIAVIDSDSFAPNNTWSQVVRDQVWEAACQALEEAAERLVRQASSKLGSPYAVSDQEKDRVYQMFQNWAGQRFQKHPEKVKEATGLAAEMADALLWETVTSKRVSLRKLVQVLEDRGVIWTVEKKSGQPREGRIILSVAAPTTRNALEIIFGPALQDGSKILKKDAVFARRRKQAPRLVARLDPDEVLRLHRFIHSEPDGSLSFYGEAGPTSDRLAAGSGLEIRVGLEGRLLCQIQCPHPLGGLAVVNCEGLQADEQWKDIANSQQADILARVVSDAMWHLVSVDMGWSIIRPAAHDRRPELQEFMLTALDYLLQNPDQDPSLKKQLLQAPLFETTEGMTVNPAGLLKQGGPIRLVSRDLAPGKPADDIPVLRSGPRGIQVLKRLLGKAVECYDDQWRKHLTYLNRATDHGVLAALRPTLQLEILETRNLEFDAHLILKQRGWILNTSHPAWQAAKRAQAEPDPDRPDPVLHLCAAIQAALRGRTLSAEDVVAYMELLAERAQKNISGG